MSAKPLAKNADFISFVLRIVAGLFGLGALFVPFGTGLKSEVSSSVGPIVTNYSPAFSFIFGGEITTGRVTYASNGVSVINTIAYILAALFILLLVVFFVLRSKPKAKWFLIGASVSSLVSAILVLCSHTSAATFLADSILGRRSESVVATMIKNTTLQFGFWGMALFGFLATVFLLASFIFDGTVDEVRAKLLNK